MVIFISRHAQRKNVWHGRQLTGQDIGRPNSAFGISDPVEAARGIGMGSLLLPDTRNTAFMSQHLKRAVTSTIRINHLLGPVFRLQSFFEMMTI